MMISGKGHTFKKPDVQQWLDENFFGSVTLNAIPAWSNCHIALFAKILVLLLGTGI